MAWGVGVETPQLLRPLPCEDRVRLLFVLFLGQDKLFDADGACEVGAGSRGAGVDDLEGG